jgi:hypothetical protein
MVMSAAAATAEGATRSRDWFLTIIAILVTILAISDFTKTLQHAHDPGLGLVILGHRFGRVGYNIVGGSLFGIFLLAYAYGLFTMKRWVLPMAVVYAYYVPTNMVMFWSLHENPLATTRFIVIYLGFALTGSVGTAIYLAYHRDRLT